MSVILAALAMWIIFGAGYLLGLINSGEYEVYNSGSIFKDFILFFKDVIMWPKFF